jgi:glutamate synthase (NADPH/NADH) small chain
MKFACVDGPDFDGHQVDFDEVMQRASMYREFEQHAREESCNLLNVRYPKMPNMSLYKEKMPQQDPNVRNKNFDEVALGYLPEQAANESDRCLQCKARPCVSGCPVNVDIPGFIARIKEGDMEGAYEVLTATNSLPAVCGRVCRRKAVRSKCVRGKKGEPVGSAVWSAMWPTGTWPISGRGGAAAGSERHKVAVVGAGPAGLTCAGDLVRLAIR